MMSSDDQILNRIRSVIAEVLRTKVEEVGPHAALGEALGAASLDYVDIQFRLEQEFGVQFFQGSTVDKLAELFSPCPLEKGGLLTAFGSALLRLRLPEVDPARLQEGQPVAAVEALYTPRTWVRVIKELLSARPTVCPACGSRSLTTVEEGLTVSCTNCSQRIPCPSGEECLELWAKGAAASLKPYLEATSR